MISLTKPKFLVPVSGNYKHMKAYQHLGNQMGYEDKNIVLTENGQEIVFTKDSVSLGRKIEIRNVFVDQISGEEVESYVLRDREKLAKEGIVIIMTEINAATGQLIDAPALVTRGFNPADQKTLTLTLPKEIQNILGMKKGKVNDWVYLRKLIGDTANKQIFKTLRRRPLVLPVIIEI
jgi:ribonuclease J